ncbi:MAG: hypothetical protein QXL51_06365 [Candidatus Aenigmatarchaeota archaeon]
MEEIDISGKINCYIQRKKYFKDLKEYWFYLLETINKNIPIEKREMDKVFLKGGEISLFQYPSIENDYISIIINFNKVKEPFFLDSLTENIMKISNKCFLTCSIRKKIDFNELKEIGKKGIFSKWIGETSEGNYSFIIYIDNIQLKILVYPNIEMININALIDRDIEGREIFKKLFKKLKILKIEEKDLISKIRNILKK